MATHWKSSRQRPDAHGYHDNHVTIFDTVVRALNQALSHSKSAKLLYRWLLYLFFSPPEQEVITAVEFFYAFIGLNDHSCLKILIQIANSVSAYDLLSIMQFI
jgi:hypothetical protein